MATDFFYDYDNFQQEMEDKRMAFFWELSLASACVVVVGLLLNARDDKLYLFEGHLMTACLWNQCGSTFYQWMGAIVLWDVVLLLATGTLFALPGLYAESGLRAVPALYPYLLPVALIAFTTANLLVVALASDRLRQARHKYRLRSQGCVCFSLVLVHVIGVGINLPKFLGRALIQRQKQREFESVEQVSLRASDPPRLVVTEGWVGRMPEYFLFSMGSFLLLVCIVPWLIMLVLALALPIKYAQLNKKISKMVADAKEACRAEVDKRKQKKLKKKKSKSKKEHKHSKASRHAEEGGRRAEEGHSEAEDERIFGSDPRRRLSFFNSKSAVELRRAERLETEQAKTRAAIWALLITLLFLTVTTLFSVYMSVFVAFGNGVLTWELEWVVIIVTAATRNIALMCLR